MLVVPRRSCRPACSVVATGYRHDSVPQHQQFKPFPLGRAEGLDRFVASMKHQLRCSRRRSPVGETRAEVDGGLRQIVHSVIENDIVEVENGDNPRVTRQDIGSAKIVVYQLNGIFE